MHRVGSRHKRRVGPPFVRCRKYSNPAILLPRRAVRRKVFTQGPIIQAMLSFLQLGGRTTPTPPRGSAEPSLPRRESRLATYQINDRQNNGRNDACGVRGCGLACWRRWQWLRLPTCRHFTCGRGNTKGHNESCGQCKSFHNQTLRSVLPNFLHRRQLNQKHSNTCKVLRPALLSRTNLAPAFFGFFLPQDPKGIQ